jgi:hypothetical protein
MKPMFIYLTAFVISASACGESSNLVDAADGGQQQEDAGTQPALNLADAGQPSQDAGVQEQTIAPEGVCAERANHWRPQVVVSFYTPMEYTFVDGRENAMVASVFVYACAQVELLRSFVLVTQEEELAQVPQNPDDATGLYINNSQLALNSVNLYQQSHAGDVERVHYGEPVLTEIATYAADSLGAYNQHFRDPVRMAQGDWMMFTVKVSIARNASLSGGTQRFTLLPQMIYKSFVDACGQNTVGCISDLENESSAPTLIVQYQ